ncbi:MAG: molecular chaperone DnaJ [Chromatiaceae bacterium]|nr:molecular chaperone DnaJ [Chromatiaceae bacterium]
MEFSGEFFPVSWLWLCAALYGWLMSLALRWANWGRLRDPDQLNLFLGTVVALLLLWTLRTEVQPGFAWHLSAMVSVTLMFGWSLAVLAGSLALFGTTLVGLGDWSGYIPSALVFIVLPVSLTQLMLGLARAYLPKHYFVYVFINAFLAGGLVSLLVALMATGLLLLAGAFSLAQLSDSYLLFLPLMFFPEAVLNGWMISIMVGFKPQWVGSFRDEEYLHGK